jgi:hypothetical protein
VAQCKLVKRLSLEELTCLAETAERQFIEGGGRPGCIRVPITASDRLTAEEVATLRR